MSKNNIFDRSEVQMQDILTRVVNNQVICKLLKYNTPDALSMPDITYKERVNLLYDANYENRRLFSNKPLDVISDSAMTLLSVVPVFDDYDLTTAIIKYHFFISCQEKIQQIEGGFRAIRIMSELYSMFHGVNFMRDGDRIGYKIQFGFAHPYVFNDRYYGYEVQYLATEFKSGCF